MQLQKGQTSALPAFNFFLILFQLLLVQVILMWGVLFFFIWRRVIVLENASRCKNIYELKLKKKVTAIIEWYYLVIFYHCINHKEALPEASKLS